MRALVYRILFLVVGTLCLLVEAPKVRAQGLHSAGQKLIGQQQITPEISCHFADSMGTMLAYRDSMRFYSHVTDSFHYQLALMILSETIDPDSISLIDGVDANLSEFVRVQFGVLDSFWLVQESDKRIIHYTFLSREPVDGVFMINRGRMIYYRNYLLFIQFSNLPAIDGIIAKRRDEFLSGLKWN